MKRGTHNRLSKKQRAGASLMLLVISMSLFVLPSVGETPAELKPPITSKPAANGIGQPISLPPPDLRALISVDDRLDPYSLDAESHRSLTLRDALTLAVMNNLDIGIARSRQQTGERKYVASLGKFLPDLTTGYSLYGLAGRINLPFATASASSPAAAGSTASGGMSGGGLPAHFNVATAGFTYNGYQGGRILFGALEQLHNSRAQRAGTHTTISDTLMQVTRDYYNLVLQENLLNVRIRAVDTSNEQVRINTKLANNGLATNLDILQADTQLSRDRQDLVVQEVERRSAAIRLATSLNALLGEDITAADRTVQKNRLVSTDMRVQRLLQISADNRPELRETRELWLAARKAIGVAAAPLQPTVKLQGNVYGLGQQLQNMSTLYVLALNARWDVHGLGVTDSATTAAAKAEARERMLQQNKTLLNVFNEVRNAYLDTLRTERNITETENEVRSAQEELRLAKIRFEQGLGANIDVVSAQRDVTSALVNHARAVVNFNIAEAQLLHDIGLISVDSLTASQPLNR